MQSEFWTKQNMITRSIISWNFRASKPQLSSDTTSRLMQRPTLPTLLEDLFPKPGCSLQPTTESDNVYYYKLRVTSSSLTSFLSIETKFCFSRIQTKNQVLPSRVPRMFSYFYPSVLWQNQLESCLLLGFLKLTSNFSFLCKNMFSSCLPFFNYCKIPSTFKPSMSTRKHTGSRIFNWPWVERVMWNERQSSIAMVLCSSSPLRSLTWNNLSIKIFFKSAMKSLHEINRRATLSVEILHEDQYDVKLIRELPS